jgi:hypothetical protein
MAITYRLYCKECYNKLSASGGENPDLTVRPHTSYFICSGCSFETDRGYAVQEGTNTLPSGPRFDKRRKISAGLRISRTGT